MATRIDSPLILGNKALQEKRYSDAIELFEQAIQQHPKLEKYISFNILLAKSKQKNKGFAESTFNKAIAQYIDETGHQEKLPLTVLIITGNSNQSAFERAYAVTQMLDCIVENAVIGCVQEVEQNVAPIISPKYVDIPVFTIKKSVSSEVDQLEILVEKLKPDFVVACNIHLPFYSFGSVLRQRYGIPLIVDADDSSNLGGGIQYANSFDKFNFSKIFLVSNDNSSVRDQLRSLVLSSLKRVNSPVPNDKAVLPDLKKIDVMRVPEKERDSEKDIVIFWKQNDTGLYGRRPDMIIKYLASRKDVRKVIVIDAPIFEKELIGKRNGSPLTHDKDIYVKTYEKIFGQLDQEKISFHVYINKDKFSFSEPYDKTIKKEFYGYSMYLDKLFQREQIDSHQSIFWFFPKNYFGADIIETFKPKKIVVDVVDDHRAWPDVSAEERKKLTNHYKDFLSRADICIANCRPLVDSMKKYHKDIILIPNGCEDSPEFVEPFDNVMYEDLKGTNKKIIGFVGNLESKIDIRLLEKLAEAFRDEIIVLVGSTHANPEVKELSRYPNIRMFGVVEYKYISAIVKQFSVGIVPHLKTPLTENMCPLKVFVYAANQVPVVCSNINNVPEGKFIHMAMSHNEFVEKCKSILAGATSVNNKDYFEFIEKNSWHSRFHDVLNNI